VFSERIIARCGVPKVVLSENGVQFASRVLKSFLAEMGINQQFTEPYTPQENPTERANRTVKTMIAQFEGQDQRNWDQNWPEIMLAAHQNPPAIHRRSIVIPIDLVFSFSRVPILVVSACVKLISMSATRKI